jgi:hypothetical protein
VFVLCPTEQARDERNHQKGKEDEEQDLRDTGRGTSDAAKAKKTGNECDYEKDDSIIKHFRTPSVDGRKTTALQKSSAPMTDTTTRRVKADRSIVPVIFSGTNFELRRFHAIARLRGT